jgi:hypothetical protein
LKPIQDLALKQEAIRSGVAVSHISEEKIAEIKSVIDGMSKDYSGITTAEAVRHLDYANWITGLTDEDIQSKIKETTERNAKAERDQKLVPYKNLVAKQVEDTAAKALYAGTINPANMNEFKKQIRTIVESAITDEEISIPESCKAAKDFINDAVEGTKTELALDRELHGIENKKHQSVLAGEQEEIMKKINHNIGIITEKVQEIKGLKKQLVSPSSQNEVDNQLRSALESFFIEA